MYGKDEIMITGKYKDFSIGMVYDLDGADEKTVSGILSKISEDIEPFCFKYSGIDIVFLDKLITCSGKGTSGFAKTLDEKSSEFIKAAKAKYSKEMMHVVESYYINKLAKLCDINFKPDPIENIKPKKESPADIISFVGKFKDWVAIKKLGLEKVKEYEISGILGGINYTLVNKAFDFSGIDCDESKVLEITKGKRKSIGAVSECIVEAEGNSFLICKALETLGYRPYASSHMLVEAYPDIKPPKVKGRKPKG